MIRILHIVPSLSVNSGMMSVILNYHKFIDKSKVQFDYLYFNEIQQNHMNTIHSLGGKTYCMGFPNLSVSYQKKINKFFSCHEGEYLAIHCHPIFSSQIYGIAAKRHGIKYIIAHSHSTAYSDKIISSMRNYLITLFVGCFATNYMACSKEAAYLFGKKRVNRGDVYILNNAIDFSKYSYNQEARNRIRNELNIEENKTVIGHIGRFSKEKNHSFLIDIYYEYSKINPNSILLLVGHGELLEEVKSKVLRLKLSNNVIFTGQRDDIPALLSAMDIFVLPSMFEGVPVCAIEAQASGLPCFLSDTITREVGISNATFLSLSLPPVKWAERLYSLSNQRINREANMLDDKFDISKEAIKLENYYLSLNNNVNREFYK